MDRRGGDGPGRGGRHAGRRRSRPTPGPAPGGGRRPGSRGRACVRRRCGGIGCPLALGRNGADDGLWRLSRGGCGRGLFRLDVFAYVLLLPMPRSFARLGRRLLVAAGALASGGGRASGGGGAGGRRGAGPCRRRARPSRRGPGRRGAGCGLPVVVGGRVLALDLDLHVLGLVLARPRHLVLERFGLMGLVRLGYVRLGRRLHRRCRDGDGSHRRSWRCYRGRWRPGDGDQDRARGARRGRPPASVDRQCPDAHCDDDGDHYERRQHRAG